MKVPIIMQMHSGENGAAALSMILAYYKKYLPMQTVRDKCLSSRNGSSIGQLNGAAEHFGLKSEIKKINLDELKEIEMPVIACWKKNRYVVIKGFKKGKVSLNDPAKGMYSMTEEKFRTVYKNKVLVLRPGENFEPEGKAVSLISLIVNRINKFKKSALLILTMHSVSIFTGVFSIVLSQLMLDDVIGRKQLSWYMPVLIGLCLAFIIKSVISIFQTLYSYKISREMAAYSGSKFFKKLLQLPMKFYDHHYIGDIMERFDTNLELDRSLLQTTSPRFADTVMILVYLLLMFYYNPIIAAICLGIEIIYIIVSLFLQERISTISHSLNSSSGALRASQLNGLNTMDTIKSTGTERSFFSMWIKSQDEFQENSYRVLKVNSVSTFFTSLHGSITSAVLLFVGAFFIVHGNFTLGMLSSFSAILAKIKECLKNNIKAMNNLSSMRANIERVDDILVRKIQGEVPIEDKNNIDKLQGNINIEHVTYHYDEGDSPAISDVSLKIEKGQRIALVGATGCGKSTLIKIIANLYNPNSGTISYDGHSRSEIPDAAFYASIATVDQESMLFEDSISSNLKLWDETIDDEDMIAAAKDAEIHKRIVSNKESYNSYILEKGNNYSAGEQQRLELARALAKKPSILLLDEFTSSLDAITEEKVFKAIKERGITCILAAHRMSTVADCDQIIVIEKGKIVEHGTHEQLYNSNGLYRKLMDKQ